MENVFGAEKCRKFTENLEKTSCKEKENPVYYTRYSREMFWRRRWNTDEEF